MNLHFGQCRVGQLHFLTAGAAQRSWAGSRASEFTYLASDAGKTRTAMGWQNRDSWDISFYLCVAALPGLSNVVALGEPDFLQIGSELPRHMFQQRVTQLSCTAFYDLTS